MEKRGATTTVGGEWMRGVLTWRAKLKRLALKALDRRADAMGGGRWDEDERFESIKQSWRVKGPRSRAVWASKGQPSSEGSETAGYMSPCPFLVAIAASSEKRTVT